MAFAPFSQEGEGPGGKLAKTLRVRSHEHKPTGRRWQLGSPPAEASRAAAGLFDIIRPQLPRRPIAKAPPGVRRLPALGVWCSQVIGPLFRPKAAATLSRSDGLGVHRPRTDGQDALVVQPGPLRELFVVDPVFLAEVGHAFQSSHRSFLSGGRRQQPVRHIRQPLHCGADRPDLRIATSRCPRRPSRIAACTGRRRASGDRAMAEFSSRGSPDRAGRHFALGHAARFAFPRPLIPNSLSRGSTSCGPDRSDHRHRGCRG
jgi:hypothetical protein